VHAHEALRRTEQRGQVVDRQRRGIRRDQGIGARGALDSLEHNLLDIDALEDCLENEVDITDRAGDVVGQRDATDAFQHSRLDQSHLDVPAHTLRQLRPTRRW